MKYLCIHFTPKCLVVSQILGGNKDIKFLDGCAIPLPDGSYNPNNRRYSDAGGTISALLRNELDSRRIKLKQVVAVVHDYDFKYDELAIGKTPKKYLEQLIMQTLHRTGKMQGENIVDFNVLGTAEGGERIYDIAMCPTQTVADIAGILKSSGLKAVALISEVQALKTFLNKVATTQSTPFLAIYFSDTYFHQMYWDGEQFSSVRTVDTSNKELNNDFAEFTAEKAVPVDLVVSNVNTFIRYSAADYFGRVGNNFPVVVFGAVDCYSKSITDLNKMYRCTTLPIDSFFTNAQQGMDLSVFALGLQSIEMVVKKTVPCSMFTRYEVSRGGATFSLNPLACILCVIALAVCGSGIFVNMQNPSIQAEIDDYIAYLDSPEVNEAMERQNNLSQLVQIYEQIDTTCDLYISSLTTEERFRSEVITDVQALLPEGVSITSYAFDRNILNLSCQAMHQDYPSIYTENLVQSENYVDISYGGFQKTTSFSAEIVYSFNLSITLW